MSIRSMRGWLLGLLLGCSPPPGSAAPQECGPVESELGPGATADALVGEYQLRMIATSGPKSGSAVVGRLRLQPHDSSMRRLSYAGGARDTVITAPLYGAAELDPSEVGAVYAGDLSSLDPTQPGVVVFQSSAGAGGGPRIMLRLGSEANRRDQVRFDGAYTVLRVRRVSDDEFAGSWDSGVPLPRSGGHFCATRAANG
jgi:hypothetical protein